MAVWDADGLAVLNEDGEGLGEGGTKSTVPAAATVHGNANGSMTTKPGILATPLPDKTYAKHSNPNKKERIRRGRLNGKGSETLTRRHMQNHRRHRTTKSFCTRVLVLPTSSRQIKFLRSVSDSRILDQKVDRAILWLL